MARFPSLRIDPRWRVLAVALLAGLAAAWAAQSHIQGRIDSIEARARQPMTELLVAAIDMPAGSNIDADTVAVRAVPREWAASGALDPTHFAAAQGSRLSTPLRRGDPLTWAHLETTRHVPFSAQLASGRRAITIPVDDINSMSGMLEPGDLIDLYVSFEHRRRRVTAPLLQGIKVLATGRQAAGDARGEGGGQGYATLTLDAAPEDAVKLIAARQQGSITAMLRHAGDARASVAAARGDLATLLGLSDPVPKKAPGVAVIYGDRAPREIPRMGAGDEPADVAVPGLFDAPPQALASAYAALWAARERGEADDAATPVFAGAAP